MKYLIVNGDDFGASSGVNRGIREAHLHGILTSTSLLVDAPGADEAARMAAGLPDLSLGLHADLGDELDKASADSQGVRESLQRQFRRFESLVGRPPTHIDSHHNVHRNPRALPHFLELAREHDLPLREHSPVRYVSKFYGQWDGQTHLEHVIGSEIADGISELACHPGYVDEGHATSYRAEREAELRALCDPRIRRTLAERRITLISDSEISKVR